MHIDAGTVAGIVAMLLIALATLAVVCALALSGRISRSRGE